MIVYFQIVNFVYISAPPRKFNLSSQFVEDTFVMLGLMSSNLKCLKQITTYPFPWSQSVGPFLENQDLPIAW